MKEVKKLKRFEDLTCWQQARSLVNEIFKLAAEPDISDEYTLKNQLCRAALSAMSNIAEGFARRYQGDLLRHLDYSQSSTQEVKSLLYAVSDLGLVESGRIRELQNRCDELRRQTLGLLDKLRNSF